MSRTSNCPSCTQPVTIPEGLDPAAVVRCPTCEAQFPLHEALAGAAEEEEEDSSETMAFLKSLEAGGKSAAGDVAPPELVPVAAVTEKEPTVVQFDGAPDESDTVLEEGPDDAMAASGPPAEEPQIVIQEASEEPAEAGAERGAEGEPEEPGQETAEIEETAVVDVVPQAPATEAEAGEEACPQPAAEGEAPVAEASAEEGVGGQGEPGGDGTEEKGEEATQDAEPSAEAPVQPPAVDPDPLVRGPHSDTEFRLSELIVASTGQALGPVTAAMIARHDLLRTLTEEQAEAGGKEGPVLDIWGKAEGAPQLDLGGGAAAAAIDHSGFAIRDEELEEERAVGSLAARPRRKRKEKSLGREMVGVVLGGIGGVLIASYIIVVFKGDEANFLNLPLPGCPSTYRHCPTWWPQWLKIGARQDEMLSDSGPDSSQASPQAEANASKPAAKKANGTNDPGNGPSGEQPSEGKPAKKPARAPSGKVEKPKASPAAFVGLRNPPSYTSDELGDALAKANAAFGCRNCNSTGKVTKIVTEVKDIGGKKKEVKTKKTVDCEVCQGHPPRVMKDSTYEEFCRMGEVITFVQGAENDEQLASRRRAARGLLEKAGASDADLAKIGNLAAARLADEGRLEPGIFLAGTVEKTRPQGSLHVTEIRLAKPNTSVTVLSPRSLPIAKNDRVLVLGSIVEEPRQNYGGYEGPLPIVVHAGLCVKAP